MSPAVAATIAIVLLLITLSSAVIRPRGLGEAAVAVPAAALLVALGIESPAQVWATIVRFGPTVAFLAGILLFGHLAAEAGVFRYLGASAARASRGSAPRLLVLVVGLAAAVTVVLTLDATIVLLTPVILTAATGLGAAPRPHLYATVRLANSGSLLLPVSNLTNLLAFPAIGISFGRFTEVMALPWVVACIAEWVALRLYFRGDLAWGTSYDGSAGLSPGTDRVPRRSPPGMEPGIGGAGRDAQSVVPQTSGPQTSGPQPTVPRPTAALVAVAATVGGFVALSSLGQSPAWAAFAGCAVLIALQLGGQAEARRPSRPNDHTEPHGPAQRSHERDRHTPSLHPAERSTRPQVRRLIAALNLGFCAFVLALAVIVDGAMRSGLAAALAGFVPSGTGLAALLAVAFGAALLANLVNNLPATLALIPLLAGHPALMLAMLLGVNIGPNISYAGSLATLLWRRQLAPAHRPRAKAFHGLGLAATPLILAAATIALWLALRWL